MTESIDENKLWMDQLHLIQKIENNWNETTRYVITSKRLHESLGLSILRNKNLKNIRYTGVECEC